MSWVSRRGAQGAFLLALGLVGCLGGQTGQESEAAPQCTEEAQSVELDASTPLGFSAEEVLAAAGSPLRARARFFEAGVTPEVTLTFHEATAARVVTSRPNSVECVERLEVDASVTLATDDGAFDETFTTTIEVLGVSDWSLHHTLPLTELEGNYTASEHDLQTWSSPRIRIDVDLRSGVFGGRLSLEGDDPEPNDDREPTSALLAEWPF